MDPEHTNNREKCHPQAQGGQRSDSRSWRGQLYGEGTCCDLQQRHVATPQQPSSKESQGKHPDFVVHPPSSPLVVPHQLNPTRSPRAKDLLVQPRQVQGVEQDRTPWRGQLKRQTENIQPSPWTSNHGTQFNKLQYSHTVDYGAATF